MAKQSGLSYEQIVSEIKNKQFKPVYFFEGDEAYFIDSLSDLIEANALQDFEKEFNQTILYGKDVDSGRIITEAKRFPMMADKQLVIIREAQDVKDLDKPIEIKQGKKNIEINIFEEYIKNPQTSTILVICYKYKKLDARKTLSKSIKTYASYFHSEKIKDYNLGIWIDNYCNQNKLSISPKANAMLCEYLGNDLQKISNEISKLMLNKKGDRDISESDVQTNIGVSKDYNVFELNTAIANRNILKANKIINYFSANSKEHPAIVSIATLFGYFTKVLVYHTLTDKSDAAVASAIKVNPYFVKEYVLAAKNFTPEKCVRIISYLREADGHLKGVDSSAVSENELMKELLFKILH